MPLGGLHWPLPFLHASIGTEGPLCIYSPEAATACIGMPSWALCMHVCVRACVCVHALQELQTMRDIRPMHGGPGYSEEMVTYVRALNFELD